MTNTLSTCVLIMTAVAVGPAFATDAPKLSPSAKRLTGKEIVALIDGTTLQFNDFSHGQPMTGSATYDFKTKTQRGSYTLGGETKTFEGAIRIKGNQFCHMEGKSEKCSYEYSDGGHIYATDAKGNVRSDNFN